MNCSLMATFSRWTQQTWVTSKPGGKD